jgi:putative zinc finger protein
MTEWITRPERHIPEDELHAYLDQALSRSQCAEIETHLSACKLCQARRAAVAALRDRTTALLSGLAPRPVIVPPAYQLLRDRQSRRLALAVWRARLQRASLWAAAVVGAVGAGWVARSVLDPHRAPPPILAEAPVTPTAPTDAPASASVPVDATAELERQATPLPIPEQRAPLLATRAPAGRNPRAVVPAPTLHLASVVTPVAFTSSPETRVAAPAPRGDLFTRVWRLVPWEDALQIAGSSLPFIEGLPVVGVLFQPGTGGERPTVIVAQQDPNGEVIQSIEGPVAKVDELLRRQATPDMHASEYTRTPPDYVELPGGTMRRSLRILTVTGRLATDSLNALARVATMK